MKITCNGVRIRIALEFSLAKLNSNVITVFWEKMVLICKLSVVRLSVKLCGTKLSIIYCLFLLEDIFKQIKWMSIRWRIQGSKKQWVQIRKGRTGTTPGETTLYLLLFDLSFSSHYVTFSSYLLWEHTAFSFVVVIITINVTMKVILITCLSPVLNTKLHEGGIMPLVFTTAS